MAVLAASLLFFLLLHAAVARRRRRPFHVDLRLSRGVASALLVAAGVYALGRWFALWPRGFLAANDDPVAAGLVAVGHVSVVMTASGMLRLPGPGSWCRLRRSRGLRLHRQSEKSSSSANMWMPSQHVG